MSAGAIGDEERRHVHYCKDYGDRSAKTCHDRGYCECECGARSTHKFVDGFAAYEWVMPAEAKAATT